MRYHALAVDFDGTLAHDGVVDDRTLDALKRLRASGRKLLMVTGRELDELLEVFEPIDLFDRVVAENGALIYQPDSKEIRLLTEPPSEEFVKELERRGIEPLSVGRLIVATLEPHEETVLATIRDMGLELHVIFNKGAVMVLPSGVNKATGLKAALPELGLSPHNCVGVGDAENDHAFLNICECAVAVHNALPALKERADLVLKKARGHGVIELIDRMLDNDLADVAAQVTRHHVLLGHNDDEEDVTLAPYGSSALLCGTSGSGKSTLTTGLLERLHAAGYQFVVIDPEGDYESLEFAVSLGSPKQPPVVSEVLDVLHNPKNHAVVNLLGTALEHRPAFFDELLPKLLDMRQRCGRPHWLIVDEAHHLLPTAWQASSEHSLAALQPAVYITVHPESVSPAVLKTIDVVMAVGEKPHHTIESFCEVLDKKCPQAHSIDKLDSGDLLYWRRRSKKAVLVHSEAPKAELKRHSRKYAEGNLGDESFFFRGPEGKLNLKAQNLLIFLQVGEGVDDDTWQYHRERGDYSRWFREGVKDEKLADDVADIEENDELSVDEARAALRRAVEEKYTLPVDQPSGVVE